MDRGTFVVLSKQEMADYAGLVQYITHHGVLKDSATTPLRVVTNSSFKNGKYSLNDCLPKGPNSLNDMLELITLCRLEWLKGISVGSFGSSQRMVHGLISP